MVSTLGRSGLNVTKRAYKHLLRSLISTLYLLRNVKLLKSVFSILWFFYRLNKLHITC